MNPLQRLSILVLVASFAGQNMVHADFVEDWETPAVSSGTTSTSLPPLWNRFSGSISDSQIWHPVGTARFDQSEPLAFPASGNQSLFLSGTNVAIYRMSGNFIQANTTYELTAAIGHDKLVANTQFWSLQLWADTNGSNGFEGSDGGDTFLGQEFGISGSAINPAVGAWETNTFTYDSTTMPSQVGKQLIVFLNNFNEGTSYYDNIALQTVPEPTGLALALIGTLALFAARHGRDCDNPRPSYSGRR